MASLESHTSSQLVKLLLMGNSGVGKTGALASLAAAGYRLFVCDFDNGLDILTDPTILSPEFRKNVFYRSLQDKPLKTSGRLIARATAWQEFTKTLGDWREEVDGKPVSLGNITTWGPMDVLVVDSLTFASDRAMDDALQLGGRLGQRPQIQDYGAAMDSIQATLELLYGETTTCNIVCTAHLQFLNEESSGARKAFPNVIGQRLAPKVPRYFNNMVLLEKTTVGNTITRKIRTSGTATIDLKVSKPGSIATTVEPNLATLFAALRGEAPR